MLVSDTVMPGEDGHSLIRHIWTWAPGRGGQPPPQPWPPASSARVAMHAHGAGLQARASRPADPDGHAGVGGPSRPVSA